MLRNAMFRCLCLSFLVPSSATTALAQQPEGTLPLTGEIDFASDMVDGIDRFLLRKIAESKSGRARFWNRDLSSAAAYNGSIEPNRRRLRNILGGRDERMSFDSPEIVATVDDRGVVAAGDRFKAYEIRWPVLADPAPTAKNLASIYGEGLLLIPKGTSIGNVVAIPDADQSPEQICGFVDGVPPEAQFARRAVEAGFRVVVPALISRERSKRNGRANLTNREYLYRSAFELGRHLIGYELQKVLGAVDWFKNDADGEDPRIGVIGYGEGGLLALYAAALDTRIDAVCVSGAMGPRERSWQEPLDRNVFGLLREFGGAELGTMVLPRRLIVDVANWPEVELSGDGGAPAELQTPSSQKVRDELDAIADVAAKLKEAGTPTGGITNVFGDTNSFCNVALPAFLAAVGGDGVNTAGVKRTATTTRPEGLVDRTEAIQKRQQRQFEQIDRHNQALLRESPFVRKEYLNKLNTSSVDAYEKSSEAYRETFRKDVIGEFDNDLLPFKARSRKSWETDKWTGHEVVLDVFPDVFAYGVLLLPK
ncbi:MAG: dienelactone hydrolase family protein, partial [Fuerstiella sp.]